MFKILFGMMYWCTCFVTYNKFEDFVRALGIGEHADLNAALCKVYLTNNTPSASLDNVLADLAESVTGTGYTAGGDDSTNTYTESGGTATMGGTDIVWTAGAADWSAHQFAVFYNDTPTSPANPLIAWWDYGSSITLGNGETFTVDFASAVIFTLA